MCENHQPETIRRPQRHRASSSQLLSSSPTAARYLLPPSKSPPWPRVASHLYVEPFADPFADQFAGPFVFLCKPASSVLAAKFSIAQGGSCWKRRRCTLLSAASRITLLSSLARDDLSGRSDARRILSRFYISLLAIAPLPACVRPSYLWILPPKYPSQLRSKVFLRHSVERVCALLERLLVGVGKETGAQISGKRRSKKSILVHHLTEYSPLVVIWKKPVRLRLADHVHFFRHGRCQLLRRPVPFNVALLLQAGCYFRNLLLKLVLLWALGLGE